MVLVRHVTWDDVAEQVCMLYDTSDLEKCEVKKIGLITADAEVLTKKCEGTGNPVLIQSQQISPGNSQATHKNSQATHKVFPR